MVDFVIVVILAVVVGSAARYVYKAKKSGAKCIGCPAGGNCSGSCGGGETCSCGCDSAENSCCCDTEKK